MRKIVLRGHISYIKASKLKFMYSTGTTTATTARRRRLCTIRYTVFTFTCSVTVTVTGCLCIVYRYYTVTNTVWVWYSIDNVCGVPERPLDYTYIEYSTYTVSIFRQERSQKAVSSKQYCQECFIIGCDRIYCFSINDSHTLLKAPLVSEPSPPFCSDLQQKNP